MSKNNFTRTNVDVQTMEVSAPSRSSFNLSKRDKFSLPFAKFMPLRTANIMPNSTLKGSVQPDLQMENFATPSAGPMRLDTHNFIVPARRVNNKYKEFQKSAISGTAMSLPSFTIGEVVKLLCGVYLHPTTATAYVSNLYDILDAAKTAAQTTPTTPDALMKCVIDYAMRNAYSKATSLNYTYGYMQDFLAMDQQRLKQIYINVPTTYKLGDLIYDLFYAYLGEGSIMDNLGYDIISYFGDIRENLNDLDTEFRDHAATFASYIALFNTTDFALDKFVALKGKGGSPYYETAYTMPEMCEMQLRAAYACWFDWMRNYHVEKATKVLDPDDFNQNGLIDSWCGNFSNAINILQLLAPHARNWSRDMFTMVQPDNVYRHVYAPASAESSSATMVYGSGDDPLMTHFVDVVGAYINISGDEFEDGRLSFPSSYFTQFGSTNSSFSTFYHDLQTMRRANMLEKYLQKNYYNSDTFAGQIEAHYGVKPSDYSILVSQYIGGNETLITGKQEIAPVNTPTSSAGERTLVANAGSADSFAYMCSDASYLINFASIVPIVSYDVRNPWLHELNIMEQPIPEYSNDNRIIIRTCDLMRNFNDAQDTMLGYVPRYYQYRHALDAVHGKYLREYRSYDWIRDRYTSAFVYQTGVGGVTNNMLTISPYSQHINIAPDCFLGLKQWDSVAFGTIKLDLVVECPLAGKVEFI